VRRAIAEVANDVGNYPDANCTALARSHCRAHRLPPGAWCGDGSEDLIKISARLSRPGDLVVTQRPVFGLHEIYPR
jgi:histidinol-phosphate aminotransferase